MSFYARGIKNQMKMMHQFNENQYKSFISSMKLPCTLRWDIPSFPVLCLFRVNLDILCQYIVYLYQTKVYRHSYIRLLDKKTPAELATIISQNSFFCMYLIFQFTSMSC
jgi:hypothetical protein